MVAVGAEWILKNKAGPVAQPSPETCPSHSPVPLALHHCLGECPGAAGSYHQCPWLTPRCPVPCQPAGNHSTSAHATPRQPQPVAGVERTAGTSLEQEQQSIELKQEQKQRSIEPMQQLSSALHCTLGPCGILSSGRDATDRVVAGDGCHEAAPLPGSSKGCFKCLKAQKIAKGGFSPRPRTGAGGGVVLIPLLLILIKTISRWQPRLCSGGCGAAVVPSGVLGKGQP